MEQDSGFAGPWGGYQCEKATVVMDATIQGCESLSVSGTEVKIAAVRSDSERLISHSIELSEHTLKLS